jgi:hypothetical protein
MGISDWVGGTKCSECGQRIQGQKISRTVMGTSVWICGICDQRHKEELQRDLQKSRAEEGERKKRLAADQERRLLEAATAIQQRSDAEIAEAMSRVVLLQFGTFHNELRAAGQTINVHQTQAFFFILAASAYPFRGFLRQRIGVMRFDRIEALASRYALAGLIRWRFRSENPPDSLTFERQQLLERLIKEYRETSVVHLQNISKLLKTAGEEAIPVFFMSLCRTWFEKDFLDSLVNQKDKGLRLIQFAGQVFHRAMSAGGLLESQLAQLASHVNTDIEFGLPGSWHLRRRDPYTYYDAGTPQYELAVTVGKPQSRSQTVIEFVHKIIPTVAPGAEPVSLSPLRASFHYRTTFPIEGQPKDDHHWILAEKRGNAIHHALFTLSVQAAHADRGATDVLVAFLDEKIQQARFLA